MTPGHLIDLLPTVLEVTGAKRPAEVAGLPVPPLPGKSLVASLRQGRFREARFAVVLSRRPSRHPRG